MANTITEAELSSIKLIDISIQTLPTGKDFLILICETKDDSNRIMELINKNPFDLKIFIEPDGHYALSLEFHESEYVLKFVTPKTETNYPPVKKLDQITFITAGVWTGESAQGRQCEYHRQMFRLREINIGESFSLAKKVDFVTGDEGKRPSLVVLVYENWTHISEAEAMEAFNELALRSKGNPKLEIVSDGTTVSLKIWDILIDLEVNINGLKYESAQLAEFLKVTDPQHSFAFALGFPPEGDGHTALAATKEGPQFVTIYGYLHKES